MRLLLILLTFVGLSVQGQNASLQLVLGKKDLDEKQKSGIANFIDSQTVEQVFIEGTVAGQGNVSKNRISMEYQVLSIKNILQELGVQGNIDLRPFESNDSVSANQVQLVFTFRPKLKGRELKKSSIVEISEVNIAPIAVQKQPVVKKEVEVKSPPKKKTFEPKILSFDQFKEGELVRIPNLIFRPGSAVWRNESQASIVELYRILKSKPSLKIELHGHVCCDWSVIGTKEYTQEFCMQLSTDRAESVYNFMILNGIDKSRLLYRGFGANRKLRDDRNDNQAAYLNRRVEVLIVSE